MLFQDFGSLQQCILHSSPECHRKQFSVTLLKSCLQCFLQKCGLTAKTIHPGNKGVLGLRLPGILISWKVGEVQGLRDAEQSTDAKLKRQQFVHCINYLLLSAWTARSSVVWFNKWGFIWPSFHFLHILQKYLYTINETFDSAIWRWMYPLQNACYEVKAASRRRQGTSLTQWPTDSLAHILAFSHTGTHTHTHPTLVSPR